MDPTNKTVHHHHLPSSMDPTNKTENKIKTKTKSKSKSKKLPSDPFPSSSLNKGPISQNPKSSSVDRKPTKSADPPRVHAHLQAKLMTVSTNAGPSLKNQQNPSTNKKPTPKPNKCTIETMNTVKEGRRSCGGDDKNTVKEGRRSCGGDEKRVEEKKGGDDEKRLVSLDGGRRRSFCDAQMELASFLSSVAAKVFSMDMPPFMQIHAVGCARRTVDGLDKFSSKTLAFTLKKEFDGGYGPAWHCIVGTSFGSFVTHSVGGFIYFSIDKLYVLLFKTTVQRAD